MLQLPGSITRAATTDEGHSFAKPDVKGEPVAVAVIAPSQQIVSPAKVQSNLLPVPQVSDVESARTQITKTLANEYKKAKTVEQMRAIAVTLLERAANPKEAPVDRYACFLEACDQYVEIGDVLAAFKAVDSMQPVFNLANLRTERRTCFSE